MKCKVTIAYIDDSVLFRKVLFHCQRLSLRKFFDKNSFYLYVQTLKPQNHKNINNGRYSR